MSEDPKPSYETGLKFKADIDGETGSFEIIDSYTSLDLGPLYVLQVKKGKETTTLPDITEEELKILKGDK